MQADRLEAAASGAEHSGGQPEDAVQQAKRWLAERGVVVPADDPSESRTTPEGPAEAATPSRDDASAAPPDGDSLDAQLVRGAGTRHARGFGTSGSEDRPRRRRAQEGQRPTVGDSDADPESVARTIVLRKLAAQARTRAELEKALEQKDVPDQAARSVLDRMETLGLINDQGFARDWVESRQQRRYLSKGALRRELSARGIDADEIETALSTVDGEDELSAARQLAAKKVKAMDKLERPVQYRRLVGMLGRRGFSSAVVGRVVSETLDLKDT